MPSPFQRTLLPLLPLAAAGAALLQVACGGSRFCKALNAPPALAISYDTPKTFPLNRPIPDQTPKVPPLPAGTTLTYTLVGNLPAGLSLKSGTGVISGIPTSPDYTKGGTTFTVQVDDGRTTASCQVKYTILDAPPALADTTFTETAGAGQHVLVPDSGGPVQTFQVEPGSLNLPGAATLAQAFINPVLTPAGTLEVDLDAGGTTPANAAPYTFKVDAANDGGTSSATVQIKVLEPGQLGLAYNPMTIPVLEPIPAPSPYVPALTNATPGDTVTYQTAALPAGLTLNPGGTAAGVAGSLSGTPTTVDGPTGSDRAVTATETVSGRTDTYPVHIVVTHQKPQPAYAAINVDAGSVGAPTFQPTLSAFGAPPSADQAQIAQIAPIQATTLGSSNLPSYVIVASDGTVTVTDPPLTDAGKSFSAQVVAHNDGGDSAPVPLVVTITPPKALALAYAGPFKFPVGTDLSSLPQGPLTPTVTNLLAGSPLAFQVAKDPNLTPWLGVNADGSLAGKTPNAPDTGQDYVIQASNALESASTTVHITVFQVVDGYTFPPTSAVSFTATLPHVTDDGWDPVAYDPVNAPILSVSTDPATPPPYWVSVTPTTTGSVPPGRIAVASIPSSAIGSTFTFPLTFTNAVGAQTVTITITVN